MNPARLPRPALFLAPVLVLVLLISLLDRMADRFAYALPWHLPTTVHYRGRDYIDPSECATRRDVATRFGHIARVGTVFGWLSGSRALYVRPAPDGLQPTIAFVANGDDCLVVYGLSGGP